MGSGPFRDLRLDWHCAIFADLVHFATPTGADQTVRLDDILDARQRCGQVYAGANSVKRILNEAGNSEP